MMKRDGLAALQASIYLHRLHVVLSWHGNRIKRIEPITCSRESFESLSSGPVFLFGWKKHVATEQTIFTLNALNYVYIVHPKHHNASFMF